MAFDTEKISAAFVAAHGGDMMMGLAAWHKVKFGIDNGDLKNIEVDDKKIAKLLLKYIKYENKNTKVLLNGKEFTGGFWG